MQQPGGQGQRRHVAHTTAREQGGRAQRHQHETHVLRRREGQQPFEVGSHRCLQHPEQGGDRADREHHQSPPARAWPEDVEVDADDAVHAEGDHRGAHQRRGRARRFGVRPRQPGMQRQQAGLGAEAEQRQNEDHGAGSVPDIAYGEGDLGEPRRACRGAQQEQPEQDRHESQVRQDRVVDPRRADLSPSVAGEHQHHRRDRHQFPHQKEGGHGSRRGHQQHGRDEDRHHGQREAAEVTGARVARAVDADDHGHCTGQQHEEAAQRREFELHADHREETVEAQRPGAAGQRDDAAHHAGEPDQRRRRAAPRCRGGAPCFVALPCVMACLRLRARRIGVRSERGPDHRHRRFRRLLAGHVSGRRSSAGRRRSARV